MYADDIVIFSNTKSGLQKKVDKLHEYCKEWCLEINLNYTRAKAYMLIETTLSSSYMLLYRNQ
jgi:hypothetical protein